MKTATQLSEKNGSTAEWYSHQGVTVTVQIMDTREVWGAVQYLVAPVSGFGSAWVSSHKLNFARS